MPRLALLAGPGTHPVILGRIEKGEIFRGEKDRAEFVSRMGVRRMRKGCLIAALTSEMPLKISSRIAEKTLYAAAQYKGSGTHF